MRKWRTLAEMRAIPADGAVRRSARDTTEIDISAPARGGRTEAQRIAPEERRAGGFWARAATSGVGTQRRNLTLVQGESTRSRVPV